MYGPQSSIGLVSSFKTLNKITSLYHRRQHSQVPVWEFFSQGTLVWLSLGTGSLFRLYLLFHSSVNPSPHCSYHLKRYLFLIYFVRNSSHVTHYKKRLSRQKQMIIFINAGKTFEDT